MSRTYYVAGIPYSDELFHHGVKGQKWGVRRSREELGYGPKGHLNTIQKWLVSQYAAIKKGEERASSKAEKAKAYGNDPSKYMNRAKKFMTSANTFKMMAKKYSSLSAKDQKSLNRKVVAMQWTGGLLGGALGATVGSAASFRYLDSKLRN